MAANNVQGGLFGNSRAVVVHYEGYWNQVPIGQVLNIRDYVGGRSAVINEVSDETLSIIQLVDCLKDQDRNLVPHRFHLSWVLHGARIWIHNDEGLLDWFHNSEADEYGFIHLVAEVAWNGGGFSGILPERRTKK